MPQYQFRCHVCGTTSMQNDRDPHPCPVCRSMPRRVWSFNTQASMPDHFNHSVGQYVGNKREFFDALKRQSDESSERLGMTVDLQPLSTADMAEAAAHGVTEEGLDDTRRATFVKD